MSNYITKKYESLNDMRHIVTKVKDDYPILVIHTLVLYF